MTTFPNIKSSVKKYPLYQNAFIPRTVVIPLCQEKGVNCRPVVGKGDSVKEGQVIAVPVGDSELASVSGAKIHSPVPGIVSDIFKSLNINGKPEVCIKITLAGSFSYTGKNVFSSDWKSSTSSYISEKLDDYGIINSFDVLKPESINTQIKSLSDKAFTVIVRLFDEDPVRQSDSYISMNYFSEVQTGAQILLKASGLKRILYFAGNSELASSIKNKLLENESLFIVNSKKYPSGFKKELCQSYNKANRKDVDNLISEEDYFIDSSSLFEINKAIEKGIPSIDHLVQISGDCIPSSCVLNVKIGTTLLDLVQQIGGFINTPNLIIVNGHITGNSVSSLNAPVTKTLKSVSFVSAKKTPEQLVYECSSCGNCRDICPRGLSPDLLYKYMDVQYPLPEAYIQNTLSCSECGLCNTVCSSRLPLQQVITLLKEKLAKEENK